LSVLMEHLSKTYQSPDGEVCAVADVTLNINDGEFISIVGPSGCGKSTLLSMIAGLESPSSGAVYIDGEKICGTSSKIGFMPQRDHLFPWRTIKGNVMLGLELSRNKSKAQTEHVLALLQRYGLSEFAHKTPSQLSGGMRQRCALIRALATEPKLLLLDEPFSALDHQTRLSVSVDIHRIIRQEGKTSLLVTHDISEAISLSDRIVVLSHRPATVKSIHDLSVLQCYAPMERRAQPEFQTLFHHIWKELDIND